MYLNYQMSRIAKSLLCKEDLETIKKLTGIAESSLMEVIKGRQKTTVGVIDVLQKILKMRHEQQLHELNQMQNYGHIKHN